MNKSGIKVDKKLKLVFEEACKASRVGYTELTKVSDPIYTHYQIHAKYFQQVFTLGIYFAELGG